MPLPPVLHGLRDSLPQVQDFSEVDDPRTVGVVPDVDDRYELVLLAQGRHLVISAGEALNLVHH